VSLVGNWTEKGKKEPHCAGERSQHACDRAPGEHAPKLYELALGERSQHACECVHSGFT
jgi:hypothetical protein